ncbi:hypothetical protein N9D38_11980 [Rubripirellula sp.]|nr:hypothetical protein [Rubripirellula sp.]
MLTKKKTLSFPHHTLIADEVRGSVRIIDGLDYDRSAPQVVQSLRRRDISRLLFIHGTFAGDDVSGLFRQISHLSPTWSSRLKQLTKKGVDTVAGESGNFAPSYVDTCNQFLASGSSDPATRNITADLFSWSGENHHLGRLHAALKLLRRLQRDTTTAGEKERVLILAHSHGGNVLAILSHLITLDRTKREKFLRHLATASSMGLVVQDGDETTTIRQILQQCDAIPEFDCVTLGTPLRYRWSAEFRGKIIHVINHRVMDNANPYRCFLPIHRFANQGEFLGDLIQQVGVGGSDFPPSIFTPKERRMEAKLARLFESTVKRKDYLRKLKVGRRESSDGTTLLLDYLQVDPANANRLLGHGIYTAESLLPLHLAVASTEINRD